MLKTLNAFTIALGVGFSPLIYAALIIYSLVFGIFRWFMRDSKWFLGCIPIVNIFYRKSLGYLPIWLTVLYVIYLCSFLAFFAFIPTVFVVIVTPIMNYLFAKNYMMYANPLIYSLVPFGKFYCMAREVSECRNYSRENSTRKTPS